MSGITEPVPRLSVAMIVKNEADHLPRFLEQVGPLADEICVLDTGSNDGTPVVARRFGCRVHDFVWRDDFAAARNASLALCRGAWILVLDADERIAKEDHARVRALLRDGASSRTCFRFITRNYTNAAHLADYVPCAPGNPHARGFSGWFPSGKVRLFPNLPGARFEGRVHELVNASLERAGCVVRTTEIPVHHYPFERTDARIAEKRAFYLHLAKRRAEDEPENAVAHAVLAEQYVEQGDYGGAAAAYRQALRRDPANASWLAELGGMLLLLGRVEEARRALTLTLQLDPAQASAWRNLGVLQGQGEDWAAAVDCFQQATQCDPANGESHRYLAVALKACGRMAEAAEAAGRAVRLNPGSVEAARLHDELTGQGDDQPAQ